MKWIKQLFSADFLDPSLEQLNDLSDTALLDLLDKENLTIQAGNRIVLILLRRLVKGIKCPDLD